MADHMAQDAAESKSKRRGVKRRAYSYSGLPVDTSQITLRTFDLHDLACFGAVEPKIVSLTLMMVWWSWVHQRQLPDSPDLLSPNQIRAMFSADVRTVRRLYAKCLPLARRMARGRAPFHSEAHHDVFKKSDGRCYHCGEPIEFETFHIDHLVPVACGGLGSEDNLVASCPRCNLSKGARMQ